MSKYHLLLNNDYIVVSLKLNSPFESVILLYGTKYLTAARYQPDIFCCFIGTPGFSFAQLPRAAEEFCLIKDKKKHIEYLGTLFQRVDIRNATSLTSKQLTYFKCIVLSYGSP